MAAPAQPPTLLTTQSAFRCCRSDTWQSPTHIAGSPWGPPAHTHAHTHTQIENRCMAESNGLTWSVCTPRAQWYGATSGRSVNAVVSQCTAAAFPPGG